MIRSGHTVYQASHNLLCQSLSKVFSEHHILLAGERYGVTLPWPLGVHQLTGALLLPPSLTRRGPVTWIRPPQADSLRLCREIDMFAALRTALKVPHRPGSSPDWR